MVVIYGLASSENGQIRYIGQTTKTAEKRFGDHRRNVKRNPHTPVAKWIKSLNERGFHPILVILKNDAVIDDDEIEFIKIFKENGYHLLNISHGGRYNNVSEETRKKLAEKTRLSWLKREHSMSDESKQKVSLANKGRKKPEGFGEKISQIIKNDPSRIQKLHSAESQKKSAQSRKGKIPSNLSEIHRNMIGKPKSEEIRNKIAKTLTGRRPSLETIEKRRASMLACMEKKRKAA